MNAINDYAFHLWRRHLEQREQRELIAERDLRTAEALELVDEVRALDEENQWLRKLLLLAADGNDLYEAELDVIREQLATEISRRTLGGSPPGYSNSKFNGPTPPPYISEDKAS